MQSLIVLILNSLKVHKKSVIQPNTNVTQDWIISAIKQHEGVAMCSIVNMDFQQTAPVSKTIFILIIYLKD